jgi:hypothetical protein
MLDQDNATDQYVVLRIDSVLPRTAQEALRGLNGLAHLHRNTVEVRTGGNVAKCRVAGSSPMLSSTLSQQPASVVASR